MKETEEKTNHNESIHPEIKDSINSSSLGKMSKLKKYKSPNKRRGRPRKGATIVTRSEPLQHEIISEETKDLLDVSSGSANMEIEIGKISDKKISDNNKIKDRDEKKMKTSDYEDIVVDAVYRIKNDLGSDRKSIRSFINRTQDMKIPLKVVGLCLESATMTRRLKQIERKGNNFYVFNGNESEQSIDNAIVDDPFAYDDFNESEIQFEDTPGRDDDQPESFEDSHEEVNKEEGSKKPDPACPYCFKMLLNAEKMKLHMEECHLAKKASKCVDNLENPLKLTIHLSPEKKKIRIKTKADE